MAGRMLILMIEHWMQIAIGIMEIIESRDIKISIMMVMVLIFNMNSADSLVLEEYLIRTL